MKTRIKRAFQCGATAALPESSRFILALFMFCSSLAKLTADCTPADNEVGEDVPLRLPFRVGEQYPCTQGYCQTGWDHKGYQVDFAIPSGTLIVAASAGTVVQLGTYSGNCTDKTTLCGLNGLDQGGVFVKLQHPCSEAGQAWYSSYLHLSAQSVTLGQTVAAGEILGLSGNTGLSTGPHLHFHVRKGPADNPLNSPQNHVGVRPTPMTGLETNTGANPLTTFTESHWYRAAGTSALSVGDSVQVFSRAVQGLTALAVRSEACGTQIATKADGAAGVIIGGPVFCEDYNRWQVRWSDGVEGWSGQSWLRLSADPCAGNSISPLSRNHGAGAEMGSITVVAGSGCAWTATPSAGWISITSGGSGSGNGTVNYLVSAQTSTATHNGTIAVAGKVFAITQAGATPVTAGMALIPAGSFTMGDAFSEALSDELPLHSVSVSAIYMDRYEVTKALWDDVYQWAIAHGYSFDNVDLGKAANHPVHTVNWYDMLKWCNARSEKAGLVPAYYTSATQTTVYRTGQVDVQNDWVKWNAGYRAPTEAEWEKAARGGTSGHRFPWSNVDTITHSQANYYSDSFSYNISPTRGYHPTFNDGVDPYTSPVGYFAANGYGLYDMAGNVWEWCWDWYGSVYYSSSAGTDPRGPASGTYHVVRGGSWFSSTDHDRLAYRINGDWISQYLPTYADSHRGFRTLLSGSVGSHTQSSDLTAGLVAYYPFDGNIVDASGHTRHATASGSIKFEPGIVGQAASFSQSWLQIPNLVNELQSFSISLWVNERGMTNDGVGDPEGGGEAYIWFGDNEMGWAGIASWGGSWARVGDTNVAIVAGVNNVGFQSEQVDLVMPKAEWRNRWHHCAMTYDSQQGNRSLFIDGVLVNQKAVSKVSLIGLGSIASHTWWFGQNRNYRLLGLLDELRIYDHALLPAQVQQLYRVADLLQANGPASVTPPTQVQSPTVPPRQPAENNLIVITHGYQPGWVLADAAWVDTMADAIRANLQQRGLNNWQVVPAKWTYAAGGIPETALAGAEINGALHGAQFAQQQWQHIHLIGHSAGSRFIEAFAKEIKRVWGTSTTIHSTFLDPYLSVVWPWGRASYGENSDWSDCYFAHDWTGIFTEGMLTHAHAVDVDWLDPQKQTIPRYCPSITAGSTSPYASVLCGEEVKSSHGWPVNFYLATILGTAPAGTAGYGFPLSREAAGTANPVRHPVGNPAVVLGGPPPLLQTALPQRSDAPFQFDLMSYAASDTGVTLFDRSGAGLFSAPFPPSPNREKDPPPGPDPTGVPAWLAIGVTVTNPVNWVAFDAAFASTNTAEGLLTVYWNTNRLGTLDERVTDAGLHGYRFALPDTVSSGLNVVGFRLDSFNGTRSTATVTNVALGYAGLTQPITLAMLPPASNAPPWLSLTAPAGFNYTVETSTNLQSWTPSALLVKTNGTVLFADPAATNGNQRFYRARLQ